MTFNKFLISVTILFSIILSGCATTETPTNTAANTNAKPANSAPANAPDASNPLSTTKKPEAETTNTAPTLTPVVNAYYTALRSNDNEGLKKVFSQEALKTLEEDMKADEAKTLVLYLIQLEGVPSKPFEVRNEQVSGDTAVAEIRGGAYPNGITRKFVKEGGEWKMTNESPEFAPSKK